MIRGLMALALTLLLAACAGREAPQDDGVCWRVHMGAGDAISFTPLARNVRSLETCAVLLEAARLRGEAEVNGAYQGYYLFVNASAISSARHMAGFRYPIFQPPQRAGIDRDLKKMMASRGGAMPDAADLSVERK